MDQRTSAPPELQALKNLLQLVRAMAGRGQRAAVALSSHVFDSNLAPIGPMEVASYTAMFTPTATGSGVVLFFAQMSGTFSAVDLEGIATFGYNFSAAQGKATFSAGHTTPTGGAMLFGIVTLNPGITNTLTVAVDSGVGNTITVPDGQASIMALELPG